MCRANDFTYGKYGPQEGEVKPVKNKVSPTQTLFPIYF